MIRWGLVFVMLPMAALAEPWHGIWSADPEWCANAARIGSVTPAPIDLTDTEMRGYENTCDIISADALSGLNAWELGMECHSEGDVYDEKRLVMVDDATLFMWFGAEEPVRFDRCPS